MKYYTSVKAKWAFSYTSFRVFGVLAQFREIGKSPQIMGMDEEKAFQNIHFDI